MRVSKRDVRLAFQRMREAAVRARVAHAETFALEEWSPGDGWTRYRVSEQGGGHDVSRYMRAAEAYEALHFAARLLDKTHAAEAAEALGEDAA